MSTPGRPARGRMVTVQRQRTIYDMYGGKVWSGTVSSSRPRSGAAPEGVNAEAAQQRHLSGDDPGRALFGPSQRPNRGRRAGSRPAARAPRPGYHI